MPEGTTAIAPEMLARIEERVRALKSRIEREVRSLLECSHQRQADQCDTCKGRTGLGAPMDAVLEVLKRHGLISVEPAESPKTKKTPVQHHRSLKTLLGAGIGVSFFLGFIGWQGGKLALRLIRKESTKPGKES